MADAKGKMGIICRVAMKAGRVRFTVKFSIAVAGNGAIGTVDGGEVDYLLFGFGLLSTTKGFCAHKPITAGHPTLCLALSVHDRIEHATRIIL